jgi:hypothetical protein
MTDKQLSPAAQAVLHSFWNAPVSPTRNCQIAAALLAVTKQSTFADVAVNKTIEVVPVDILLAIANELEHSND